MRKQALLVICSATLGLAGIAATASAQNPREDYAFGIRDAAAKADNDAYYFYSGEMYNTHAYDNANVLTQYILLGRPVSAEILEEHSAAIRSNLAASQKSYGRLTKEFKNNAEAEKHLKKMHEHQKAALAALDKLDAAAKSGKTDAKTLSADAKAVETELAAASGEHQRFLQKIGRAPVAAKPATQ
ncbi:MAG TPA: hypothetical protein VMF30_06300 [Pirellulales bacterium]|nr:hypothetical protein [Pirellulales bacterium]